MIKYMLCDETDNYHFLEIKKSAKGSCIFYSDVSIFYSVKASFKFLTRDFK